MYKYYVWQLEKKKETEGLTLYVRWYIIWRYCDKLL